MTASAASNGISADDLLRLQEGRHATPHDVLGLHPAVVEGEPGFVLRAFHPDAVSAEVLLPDDRVLPLIPVAPGLFAAFVPGADVPRAYRLRFRFASGEDWERDDPYRFLPTLGDMDLHLFGEGNHRRLWEILGAHAREIDGTSGVSFAVWAPGARRVSVVGDFCRWDGRLFPMRAMGSSGIFELFVPGLESGALYKYEILTADAQIRVKTDPLAFAMELPPATASRVTTSAYRWGDDEWMERRASYDPRQAPVSIYEVHLGSWARIPEEGCRPLTYREIAPRLADHVERLGFTHIELLPVAEHPFSGSWGYQVSGYYAPTSRHGTPDDFRYLVDHLHQRGIGVLVDWVPAHFPKDDFALRLFDGTALYEHADPRQGEHPDWGTLIFNFGRREVANFLLANALYWLNELHVDGLRVDAVSSMLYLDYGRQEGDWIPNEHGGRENIPAIEFLRRLNDWIADEAPGCFAVAEESTAWTGVTQPTSEGGLGFALKWNMGWMHDTLVYFGKEPVHRRFHQDTLTFAMIYEHTERFLMPLSHDEVVHGKGSLWSRMPGDPWQKLANLRCLYAYQFTRPGKKLLFMGSEFAQEGEWGYDESLDWHLLDDPARRGLVACLSDLARLYRESPALWRGDAAADGFSWVDCADHDQSILSYLRRDGDDILLVALNLTPVPRDGYRLGVPREGVWVERLSTDDRRYGGSDVETPARLETDTVPSHGQPQSLVLTLPPLAAIVLAPDA